MDIQYLLHHEGSPVPTPYDGRVPDARDPVAVPAAPVPDDGGSGVAGCMGSPSVSCLAFAPGDILPDDDVWDASALVATSVQGVGPGESSRGQAPGVPLPSATLEEALSALRATTIDERSQCILQAALHRLVEVGKGDCLTGWNRTPPDVGSLHGWSASIFLQAARREHRTVLGMLACLAMAFHEPDKDGEGMLRRQAVKSFVQAFPEQCSAIEGELNILVTDKIMCQERTKRNKVSDIVDALQRTLRHIPAGAVGRHGEAWKVHGGVLRGPLVSDAHGQLGPSVLGSLVPYMPRWKSKTTVNNIESAALLAIVNPRFKALQMTMWCRASNPTWKTLLQAGDVPVLKCLELAEVALGSEFVGPIRTWFMTEYMSQGDTTTLDSIGYRLEDELGSLHCAPGKRRKLKHN